LRQTKKRDIISRNFKESLIEWRIGSRFDVIANQSSDWCGNPFSLPLVERWLGMTDVIGSRCDFFSVS